MALPAHTPTCGEGKVFPHDLHLWVVPSAKQTQPSETFMRTITYLLLALAALAIFQAAKPVPQSKESSLFRIFNPDTLAKPTAGYSHVAEVTDGKLIYIAG